MPIPDYQTVMLPLLAFAGDGAEHSVRQAVDALADHFALTDTERSELLPSGATTVFVSRVGWARTYLKQAGLLDSPKRGVFRISPEGKTLLAQEPKTVDNSVLNQYEAFRAFRARGRDEDAKTAVQEAGIEVTPEDAMADAYRRMRKSVETELLQQIKASSPAFFEQLVVDLLVTMGYGGSRQDAGRAIGRSGDGGIDGIIKEDRLGLDAVYIQAKRWENTVVGRPEIQKFAGALQGQRAHKGIFITTSSFSREAIEYASAINTKIVLLGGDELVSLMVDYNIGVVRTGVYETKKFNADYFAGE